MYCNSFPSQARGWLVQLIIIMCAGIAQDQLSVRMWKNEWIIKAWHRKSAAYHSSGAWFRFAHYFIHLCAQVHK